MKHVVLDTETTGPNKKDGDRLLQISAVKLHNLKFTGETFNTYVNPQGREITYDSFKIHGITKAMVEHAPLYRDVHQPLVDFIDDAMLVIHNAPFDLEFLGDAAKEIGQRFEYEAKDTTDMSVDRWPGQPVNLNAVIKRLGLITDESGLREIIRGIPWDTEIPIIDRSVRHDALVDCLWTAIAFLNLAQASEFDLDQVAGMRAKPWPFGSHRIDVVPLRPEFLC
jgi:DNA polymerase-3 subunit epsilon